MKYCFFVLDESAGGSDDWAKGVGQIKYVYTVELRLLRTSRKQKPLSNKKYQF
jgi:hypothetical protein